MRRSLTFVTILAFGIVIGVIVTRAVVRPQPSPIVKTSLALDDDRAKLFILTRLKAIQWPSANGDVLFSPVGASPSPNQNITLIGRTPQTLPDDHGSSTLAVIDVSGGAAHLVCLSEFDHGSFGKNLVTVDCRVVDVELSPTGP